MSARKTTTALVVAVLGLLGAGAAQADPFDMTGRWSGQAPCDVLSDGEYTFDQFPEDNYLIAHDTVNDTIRVSAYGVVYEGTVQRLNGGPNDGEAVLRACGGDFEGYREVLRIQHIVVQEPGEARFDGKSFYYLPDGPVYGTCSYLFTRVSTDEPMIPDCTY